MSRPVYVPVVWKLGVAVARLQPEHLVLEVVRIEGDDCRGLSCLPLFKKKYSGIPQIPPRGKTPNKVLPFISTKSVEVASIFAFLIMCATI